MKKLSLIGVAALVAGMVALGSAAVAKAAYPSEPGITPSSGTKTIIQKGTCSGASTALLKVTTGGTFVQVAFQVVENQLTLGPIPANHAWSVQLVRNGSPLFSGVVNTGADRSFTVTRSFGPSVTPTQIAAGATTLDGREKCFATIGF
jgi:hypothetical protein